MSVIMSQISTNFCAINKQLVTFQFFLPTIVARLQRLALTKLNANTSSAALAAYRDTSHLCRHCCPAGGRTAWKRESMKK